MFHMLFIYFSSAATKLLLLFVSLATVLFLFISIKIDCVYLQIT